MPKIKLEKLKLILLTLVISSFFGITSQAQAASPVLYFSDLTDGPVSGWNGSPTKGAAVSIWGNNLGSSRGNSYVTIGGVNLTNDSDYAEWGATTNPTTARGLERITFWLNSDMTLGDTTITVTTPDGTSQSIPFYTRNTGHIYFVSPSGGGDGTTDSDTFSPHDYILKLEAGEDGDIAYFRAGTYNEEYAHSGWHANFCLDNNHSGILNNNNAFLSYPGEIATLAMGANADRSNFRLYSEPANYITVAKFHANAQNGAITANTGWRVIGNYVNAIHELTGSGSIGTSLYQTTADDIEILGNIITGGSSGNKLDHAIYPGSGVTNLDIGWNYIYNNNFGNGPMISINSNDAYNHNLTTTGNIHDNFIDVTNYPSRAMGVFEVGINSHLYYYNNIINGHPLDGSPTVYAMSGDVHYYNNTLYNCGFNNLGACFSFYDSTVSGHHYILDNVELKNNIVYANAQSDYYIRVSNNTPTPTIDYNLFFNILSIRTDDKYILDDNVVIQDILFSSATPSDYLDFQLQQTSPAINAGTTIVTIVKDFLGILRPQGSAYDIGAYEYLDGSSPTCDSLHLSLCNDQSSCQNAGGNWCGGVCQSEYCPPYSESVFRDVVAASKLQTSSTICTQSQMHTCANEYFFLDGNGRMTFQNIGNGIYRSELRRVGEFDTASDVIIMSEGVLSIPLIEVNANAVTFAQVHHKVDPDPAVGPLLRLAWYRDFHYKENHLWAHIRTNLSVDDGTYEHIDLGVLPTGEFSYKIEVGQSRLNVWINDVKLVDNFDISYWDGMHSYLKNGTYLGYNTQDNTNTVVKFLSLDWSVIDSTTEIRADVDQNSTINSTDAMLTLRNSLGLDMSSTNWVTGTHTGDVNCDDDSNSTDAMLILRKSLDLDMTGTGWCVN